MKTCPFGHTCEECLLYLDVEQQHADGTIERVQKCSFVAAVHAQVATFQQTHSLGAAMESTRNVLARREKPEMLDYDPTVILP